MKYLLIGLCTSWIVAGCSSGGNAPPLSADQQQQISDLDRIYKASGGDWNKVSAADKTKLIQIGGSEQGAKMMFVGQGGGIKRGPGGPPGGGPGGSPR